jgi:hypothetical protein
MAAWETHEGLLAQTIANYNRRNFVNISNTKQMYTFFPAMQGRAKYAVDNKLTFGLPDVADASGGLTFVFNVQVAKGSTFAWVTETTPINIVRKDFQRQVTLPWRMVRTHRSLNKRELSANKTPQQITDIGTSRKVADDQDFADGFEDWGWGEPPASTNEVIAFPLRYWNFTQPESTAAAYSGLFAGNGDFLNLNHASYTSGPGGLSRVTYPMWGNYNFQFTAFDSDLVDKVGHAVLKTYFHSPVDFPDKIKGTPDRAMYTGVTNVLARAKLARQQNDQNTSDLQARFQENSFFRIPMYYVPALDTQLLYGGADKRAIYGIDWSTWYLATKTEFRLQDEILQPDRSAPLDYTHHRWLECQLVCCSPRNNWVASL